MTVLYTSKTLQNFTYYSESFDYSLAVRLAVNPTLSDNENFMNNRSELRTLIDSANTAISEMQDIYAAQQSLSNANYLINNPNLFN